MHLKTSEWKKVTYSLICVFFCFLCVQRKVNRKKKIEKREKFPQGNVLKENWKKVKIPHKVMY